MSAHAPFERRVTPIDSLCSLNWPITSGGRGEGCVGTFRLFEEAREQEEQKPFLYDDDRRMRDVHARAKCDVWIHPRFSGVD